MRQPLPTPSDAWFQPSSWTAFRRRALATDLPAEPATIRTDMSMQDFNDEGYHQREPVAPLDRKLAELNTRIARLERQSVLADADAAKIRRLAGSALVLIGRRLRQENLDD